MALNSVQRSGSRGFVHLARLASTCWTLSRGPALNHATTVTVRNSTTSAMKSSRIISVTSLDTVIVLLAVGAYVV
jgi:hypothetical protein